MTQDTSWKWTFRKPHGRRCFRPLQVGRSSFWILRKQSLTISVEAFIQGAANDKLLHCKALAYLAGIGIFLSKSQRGDRPRFRESHLGGKSFLDGQHQNTTSGMVPRIPLLKIQPEERKRFSAGFIFYLFAVWEAMSAFFFRHMRCRQKQWIQLFTSHREVVKN